MIPDVGAPIDAASAEAQQGGASEAVERVGDEGNEEMPAFRSGGRGGDPPAEGDDGGVWQDDWPEEDQDEEDQDEKDGDEEDQDDEGEDEDEEVEDEDEEDGEQDGEQEDEDEGRNGGDGARAADDGHASNDEEEERVVDDLLREDDEEYEHVAGAAHGRHRDRRRDYAVLNGGQADEDDSGSESDEPRRARGGQRTRGGGRGRGRGLGARGAGRGGRGASASARGGRGRGRGARGEKADIQAERDAMLKDTDTRVVNKVRQQWLLKPDNSATLLAAEQLRGLKIEMATYVTASQHPRLKEHSTVSWSRGSREPTIAHNSSQFSRSPTARSLDLIHTHDRLTCGSTAPIFTAHCTWPLT